MVEVASELQFAALRMSAVDTPTALALEVAAPRVEWGGGGGGEPRCQLRSLP